jgi:hypothetical protein
MKKIIEDGSSRLNDQEIAHDESSSTPKNDETQDQIEQDVSNILN